MDGYQFVSSLVGSLGWPIAAVIAAFLLRGSISKLLDRIRNAKYGDASVEFSEKIQEATIAADEIDATAIQIAPPNPQPPAEVDRFTKLAELAPTLAVIEVWKSVEEAVVSLAEARHIEPEPLRPFSAGGPQLRAYLVPLREAGAIDSRIIGLVTQLQRLRNIAAHSRDDHTSLTIESTLRYKSLADTVIAALRSAAALPAPDHSSDGGVRTQPAAAGAERK